MRKSCPILHKDGLMYDVVSVWMFKIQYVMVLGCRKKCFFEGIVSRSIWALITCHLFVKQQVGGFYVSVLYEHTILDGRISECGLCVHISGKTCDMKWAKLLFSICSLFQKSLKLCCKAQNVKTTNITNS